MAALHGKSGSVTFNAVRTDKIIDWSVEATAEIVDATFMAALDATAWATPVTYDEDDLVSDTGVIYRCLLGHSSAAGDQPGTGANWRTYWTVADWKCPAAGYKKWTATVTCVLDEDGLDPDLSTDFKDANGAVLILKTGLAAGVTDFRGTAFVTRIGVAVDKRDVTKVTYEFQGSGSLTETLV